MRMDLLLEALPVMGTGYLGTFLVTGVIIVAVISGVTATVILVSARGIVATLRVGVAA